MALPTLIKPAHLSTGVFTDEELDYLDSLGPDYFPCTEIRPVSESTQHYLTVKLAFELLERVFPEPSDVFIGASNFIYWDRTQKGLVVSADLYIVKASAGVPVTAIRFGRRAGRSRT